MLRSDSLISGILYNGVALQGDTPLIRLRNSIGLQADTPPAKQPGGKRRDLFPSIQLD